MYDLDQQYNGTNALAVYDANFSDADLESQFFWTIATIIATLENMFDWLKSDITKIVDNERYGHVGWYKKMALKFQYGAGINDNYSEQAMSDFAEQTVYPTEDAGLQVVKNAFAEDNNNGIGVTIKITGEDSNGDFTPLPSPEADAFRNYMNRIKPAGIPLTIINAPADNLKLNIIIYFDPLILDNAGVSILNGNKPVEIAIKKYLHDIEFNGEFIRMKLVDAIQTVEGVAVVENVEAYYSHRAGWLPIQVKHAPFSGYMNLQIPQNLTITFIPIN